MWDIWGLTLQFFSDPEDDIRRLDLGIRSHFIDQLPMYRWMAELTSHLPFGKLVIVRDSLRMTSILWRDSPQDASFFSVGPFFTMPLEEVGVPLSSYVTTRRIEEACRLLTHSFLPVREIAGLVGIPDWNYFTKLFRKEKGCTPREYRKTMLPT